MLLPREANIGDAAKSLLCGDLFSTALLFGLIPIHYYTNANAVCFMHQKNLGSPGLGENIFKTLASGYIIIWKPVDTRSLKYDATDLATRLYDLYLGMFQDESWTRQLSSLKLPAENAIKKIKQYGLYTRASLVTIMRVIQNSGSVDGNRMCNKLIKKVFEDSQLNMGPHYFQSLVIHAYTMGLTQAQQHPWFHRSFFKTDLAKSPLKAWKNVPEVVFVTLVVPRSALDKICNRKDEIGSPICHLVLQSSQSQKQNFYPDIQLGFGTVTTSGTCFMDEYSVTVTPDEDGWGGTAPLMVSAMVTTAFLVQDGDPACEVWLALKSVPATAMLMSNLGFELALHKSAVGRKDVFITKNWPNMNGPRSICCKPTRTLSPGKF